MKMCSIANLSGSKNVVLCFSAVSCNNVVAVRLLINANFQNKFGHIAVAMYMAVRNNRKGLVKKIFDACPGLIKHLFKGGECRPHTIFFDHSRDLVQNENLIARFLVDLGSGFLKLMPKTLSALFA
jgi:hypothetical protein